jgi:hypothetical protein
VRMQKASITRLAAAEISLIGREAVLWHRLRVQVLDGRGRPPHETRRVLGPARTSFELWHTCRDAIQQQRHCEARELRNKMFHA